jgi:hypothetical protein
VQNDGRSNVDNDGPPQQSIRSTTLTSPVALDEESNVYYRPLHVIHPRSRRRGFRCAFGNLFFQHLLKRQT